MSNSNDADEPFLSRWSRRKREAVVVPPEPGSNDGAAPVVVEAEAAAGAQHGKEDGAEPELDVSKLPPVEELTESSDISAFLDRRVPAALRNAALGRMWTLDPTIRDFIEVAENQWNWNVPGGAPFYCEIEPGSRIVADAADAVTRGSTAPSSVGSSDAALPDTASNVDTHRIDSTVADDAALRHRQPSEQPSEMADAQDMSRSDNTGQPADAPAVSEAVAAQYKSADERGERAPSGRRHGGALPI